DNSFIAYHYSDDVHDGRLKQIEQNGEQLEVLIETVDGRLVGFEFSGVRSVDSLRPEGMVLYSISELGHPPPHRRFVFTNSDEEDEARLEVVAKEITLAESQGK